MTNRLPIVWHEAYEVDLGLHVFQTAKFRLVLDRLRDEGALERAVVHRPEPATREDIGLVHTAQWVEAFSAGTLTQAERLQLEVPWSRDLVRASLLCAGGTTLAARLAVEAGAAVHLGGGFHHAFADHGEGFCAVNDVAVAVQALRRDGAIGRAIVIDLDVHHGNGTAAIFAGEPDVFTLSFHQERNYPWPKPPGDLDVGLEDGTGDDEYLALLERHLPEALDAHGPDLAIYLAGADPYREDQLGGLELTLAGLAARDERVYEVLAARGIPVAVCLAGGYAFDHDDTVSIHAATARLALERFSD